MFIFSVFNYSRISDVEISKYFNNLIQYLNYNGINEQMKIEFCEEKLKSSFLEFILDGESGTLLENEDFLLRLNDYLYSISNFRNIDNYKFIFIGEEISTYNNWGDANNWVAIIKRFEEKVIWHEIAHLIGADDHYDTNSHQSLDVCTDPDMCIMTYGKLKGNLCSKSIQEIIDYFAKCCR